MTNRILSTLVLLCTLASIDVKAQSDDNNYVIKSSMLDDQGQNVVTTIEYYDGLGRKVFERHVMTQGMVDTYFVSRHYAYDGLGRMTAQALYQGNAIYGVEQRNYYDGD